VTRLTVLKKWFEIPGRLPSFGLFIASRSLRRAAESAKHETERSLVREALEILADVDIFDPAIDLEDATALYGRLGAFQNSYRNMQWASVRLIQSYGLFLVEGGLQLYLSQRASPAEGSRLAVDYCEHYDPRYFNGLNGPSVDRIEEIVRFIQAVAAQEQAETTKAAD